VLKSHQTGVTYELCALNGGSAKLNLLLGRGKLFLYSLISLVKR